MNISFLLSMTSNLSGLFWKFESKTYLFLFVDDSSVLLNENYLDEWSEVTQL